MKIESFQLQMSSSYTHERTVLSSFEEELQNMSIQSKEAMEVEEHLLEKVNFMLLQELINAFGSKPKRGLRSMHGLDIQPKKLKKLVLHTHEVQKLDFAMDGFIQTKSEKISININVSMTQSIFQSRGFNTGSFIDPLVINFNGDLPQLSQTTFNFDIDNDGESDQISKLQQGNGFLALDRNKNGSIDAGSELFGTLLGDGFKELSAFDLDKNLWIDENDPILDSLRIWVNNDNESKLLALGELGIGAIYLGNVDTDFRYKDTNRDLGELKSSGLFLHENGEAGIISQVDFAKEQKGEKVALETPPSPLESLIKKGPNE